MGCQAQMEGFSNQLSDREGRGLHEWWTWALRIAGAVLRSRSVAENLTISPCRGRFGSCRSHSYAAKAKSDQDRSGRREPKPAPTEVWWIDGRSLAGREEIVG